MSVLLQAESAADPYAIHQAGYDVGGRRKQSQWRCDLHRQVQQSRFSGVPIVYWGLQIQLPNTRNGAGDRQDSAKVHINCEQVGTQFVVNTGILVGESISQVLATIQADTLTFRHELCRTVLMYKTGTFARCALFGSVPPALGAATSAHTTP